MQTREIRGVIDQFVLFCGRFDIASLTAPEHATATSVVLKAIDTFAPEEGDEGDDGASLALSRDVVIKLMKKRETSDRYDNFSFISFFNWRNISFLFIDE